MTIMKFVLTCALALAPTATFAASIAKVCESAAVTSANADIEAKFADDCFVRFIQPSKSNRNIINVGIACDHVGSFIYQITTASQGRTCVVTKVEARETNRNL